MTEFDGLPILRNPVVVAAFEGWNDAGDSATAAVEHLELEWEAQPLASLDPEDYYDFQVNRPIVSLVDGLTRKIEWPTTRASWCSPPGAERDLVLVRGIEPNMRWRGFCDELLELFHALEIEQVVVFGALLADVPHTRPIPITGSASDPELVEKYDLEPSKYEGPTGIVGVFQEACVRAGLPTLSFWAQVPHYVAQPPSPKATLALLHQLEAVLDLRIPIGELPELAAGWESTVDELASQDSDMAEYVQALEQRDGGDIRVQPTSGEDIARELEKYLRRRGGPEGG